MTGAIVAYNPCSPCERKDKCDMCELAFRRRGVIKNYKTEDLLSDLKKEIHDAAVYPHNSGIDPYISLKVVDAIINNKLEELRNEKEKRD